MSKILCWLDFLNIAHELPRIQQGSWRTDNIWQSLWPFGCPQSKRKIAMRLHRRKKQKEKGRRRITSSMTSMEQSFKTHTPFLARSSILPGVPTSKCTGWYSLIMSSFKLVPPVETMTWIFKCFPSSLQTWDVWRANSRVGTRITTALRDNRQQ